MRFDEISQFGMYSNCVKLCESEFRIIQNSKTQDGESDD